MAKQYGLILSDKQGTKKALPAFSATKNVFGEDSDSDDEANSMNAPVRQSDKTKRQIQVVQEKALEQDPTVYQYDELFDDMEKKKREKVITKKEDKKPKYIERLLVTAEKRKKENERRVERQIQKEREEEGNEFADKESFVTSAYKMKLEEMRIDEEKQRREDYLEDICDVTKQDGLGGFYRHLYKQQLNPEKTDPTEKENTPEDQDDTRSPDDTINENDEKKSKDPNKNLPNRNYRKRKHSNDNHENDANSESDDEITKQNILDIKTNKKEKIHLQSNIDADSDFSIDSSSDEDETENNLDKDDSKKSEKTESAEVTDINEVKDNIKSEDNFKKPLDVCKIEKNTEIEKEIKEVRVKIDIWKKRTVGEVFEQALQRYYERKAARV